MDRIEIWNSAFQMVKLYQHGAERAATGRANYMLDQGDIDGFEDWTHIVDAIRDLAPKRPRAIEPVN